MINDFLDAGEAIGFEGHIDDLYDPEIHHAQDSYTEHLEDALHSSNADDLSFHVQQANDALNTVEYLQEAKAQAVFDDQLHQIDMERISRPLETQERYQEELEDIINSHGSNISFQARPVNRYDDNTIDFLNECKKQGIELPRSVDHSLDSSKMVVDRSYDGGLKSIDKSIISNSLKSNLKSGNITKDVYDVMINKLSRC